jgi:hypothetical protein
METNAAKRGDTTDMYIYVYMYMYIYAHVQRSFQMLPHIKPNLAEVSDKGQKENIK